MNSKKDIERSIGDVILEHRENMKMSRATLADRAGLTSTGLYYIETGQRTPGGKSIERIARALDMKPGELWG